jgi:hypothetical protein
MVITAERLNDGVDTVTTTSGLTASSGFTVNDFYARKDARSVEVHCYLNRSAAGAVTQTNGNITPDVPLCVLPVGWRPDHTINGAWGDGTSSGEAILSDSGTVTLRTSSSDISGGGSRNLRFSASWLVDN